MLSKKILCFFVALYLLCICSCGQMGKDNIVISKDDTISNPTKGIAMQIMSSKTVDDRSTGFTGATSRQYKNFIDLMDKATNKELLLLTDQEAPNVRAYAFWGLAKRGVNMKPILENHLKDTASFIFKSGCIVHNEHVNTFYLSLLTEGYIDTDNRKMSKKEVDLYSKMIERP